jgi:glucokinase
MGTAAMRACIDIGGTKVAVGLSDGRPGVDGLPVVLARRSEPTADRGAPGALAEQVLRMVDAACTAAGVAPADVQSAGVAAAGPFVRRDGGIELAMPNLCGGLAGPARGLPNDWTSVPLQAPLARRFADLRVENDCVAALQAERRWGALQGLDHCAYVTWSTGIGVGLCVDGQVLRGKNGNAGHAGHTFVSDDTQALCGCGNVGDVESLVAGNAIARRFGVDPATWMAQAGAGDSAALVAVDGLCHVLGRMLYNLAATLDLQCISLGGSVYWHHRDWLLPRLQAALDAYPQAMTGGMRLCSAGLENRVGDYAALALTET